MKLLLFILAAASLNLAAAQYNATLALEFTNLCNMVYCTEASINDWTCGPSCDYLPKEQFQVAHYSKTETAEGTLVWAIFLDTVNEFIIPTFRGTVGEYQLFFEILNEYDVKFDKYGVTDTVVLRYFYEKFEKVIGPVFRPALAALVQNYTTYSVKFNGHSLGAGLSSIAMVDSVLSGTVPAEKVIMYNIGSPRVGNWNFASLLVNSSTEFWRITHYQDIVPHIPLCKTKSTQEACETGIGSDKYAKGGEVVWYAWQAWNEVFYNCENCTDYKICDNTGEDPTCADQYKISQTNSADHYLYLGVQLPCPGNSQDEDVRIMMESMREFYENYEI